MVVVTVSIMTSNPTSKLTSEGALRAFYIVELLRSTGEREFPAQLMSIFFWIAAHDGCRQEDLAKACNMSTSSVSRCVTWLGPRHRIETRSGLKLVKRERDPNNHRAWRLFLTPKGRVFTNLLEEHAKRRINPVTDAPRFTQAQKEIEAYDQADEDLG